MPIDFQQIRWGKQNIHDGFLHRLADHLGIRGIDVSVIVQIKAGQDSEGTVIRVSIHRTVPRREFLPVIVAFENQGVVVRCSLHLLRAGAEHRNNPLVSKARRHQEIVGVIIAVMNVKNKFIYHMGFACKIKTRSHAESITRKNLFPLVIDFPAKNVFYIEAWKSVLPSA